MKTPINGCARCGCDHSEVVWHRFKRPIVDDDGTTWAYWTMCPASLEPVLMRKADAS